MAVNLSTFRDARRGKGRADIMAWDERLFPSLKVKGLTLKARREVLSTDLEKRKMAKSDFFPLWINVRVFFKLLI